VARLADDPPGDTVLEGLASAGVQRYNSGVSGLAVGDIIAGFRVESLAGRGGMGVVYRAVQLELDRPVAIKVISPDLALDSSYRDRFRRESRLAALIEHRNVLPVYEAGELEGGELYLAMRWVQGTDLRELLAQEDRLPPPRTVALIAQVALALDAAQAHGLVHRDVKPANVLIERGRPGLGEHVYLADFGIARGPGESPGLTTTGAFLGTLAYAAPEQIMGEKLGPAVDTYALGCVLFEALTGWPPFARESEFATMNAHLNEPIPNARLHNPDVPAALDGVIQTALAKDPADRFSSAAAMASALEDAITTHPTASTLPCQVPPRQRKRRAGRGLGTTVKTQNGPGESCAAPRSGIGAALRSRWPGRIALATIAVGALAAIAAATYTTGGGRALAAVHFRTIYQVPAPDRVGRSPWEPSLKGPARISAVPVGRDVAVSYGDRIAIVQPNGRVTTIQVRPVGPPSSPPDVAVDPYSRLDLATDPSGLLWVRDLWRERLLVIDPMTLRTLAVINVPELGTTPTFGNGYAWVADFVPNAPPGFAWGLARIDLRTRRMQDNQVRIPDDSVLQVAYAPTGNVWVLGEGAGVPVLSSVTRDGVGPIEGVPQIVPTSAIADLSTASDANGGAWVGGDHGSLVHVDRSGKRAGSPIDAGRGTVYVASAGATIWALAQRSDTLSSIPTGGPGSPTIQSHVKIPAAIAPDGLACIPHECVITDARTGDIVEATF
jgi:hypothetical protein